MKSDRWVFHTANYFIDNWQKPELELEEAQKQHITAELNYSQIRLQYRSIS